MMRGVDRLGESADERGASKRATKKIRNGATNQKPRRSRRRLHADWTSRLRSGSGRRGATVPFTKGFSFLGGGGGRGGVMGGGGGGGAGAGRAVGRRSAGDREALLLGVVDQDILEVLERGGQGFLSVQHACEHRGRLGERLGHERRPRHALDAAGRRGERLVRVR